MLKLTIPELFTLIGAVFLLSLGTLILYKNKKNVLNILFFLVSIVFSIWMFGTFMMFLSGSNEERVIFWDRFVYLGVVFMPAFEYHFSLLFTSTNKTRRILLYAAYVLSAFFLIISRTDYFVNNVFYYRWGAHTEAGFFHHLFMVFFFFYIFALLFNFLLKYKKINDIKEKKGIILLVVSFAVLNLIGGLGYLPAYKIAMYPIFLFAPTIFSILMMLSVARYQLLSSKIITAQIFSLAIVAIALVDVFLFSDINELIIKIVFFILILVLALFFSRSVSNEVRRKEELQIMSDKLSSTNDQLRKLDNAKSEFISIASHQLRTPLTAIKGFLSLMLEGSYGKLEPKHEDVLNKVYVSTERLINLVEDLLNISRIESGRMEYKFDKWNLVKMCDELIDTFVLRAKDRGLYLDCKKPEDDFPEIETDGSKLREVVSNIIDNAIKYTQRGGVSVRLSHESSVIKITVSDTGIGIPKDELPYLFSKFSRGKDTTRLNTGGTGLGLFVGKSIIESLGGKVWAESEGAGKGSRFIIELPVKRSKEE